MKQQKTQQILKKQFKENKIIKKNRPFCLNIIGINPSKMISFFKGITFYIRDLRKFKIQKGENNDFVFGTFDPILDERFSEAGQMSGHYFHQDLLIASRIYINKPKRHVDIGSRIDGFISHVAVFRKIELFDIRPQESKIKNIIFKQADLMNLSKELINSCDSVSSLHAIEHFGLGRYNDPIDYYGHIKGIDNIYKILKDGGKFYFSVPIGTQRIEFNGMRVFNIGYLLKLFENKFIVDFFNYLDDKVELFENVKLNKEHIESNYGCNYGCGIFEMTKQKGGLNYPNL